MAKYPPLRAEVYVKIDDGEYIDYETFTDEEKKEIGRKIQQAAERGNNEYHANQLLKYS